MASVMLLSNLAQIVVAIWLTLKAWLLKTLQRSAQCTQSIQTNGEAPEPESEDANGPQKLNKRQKKNQKKNEKRACKAAAAAAALEKKRVLHSESIEHENGDDDEAIEEVSENGDDDEAIEEVNREADMETVPLGGQVSETSTNGDDDEMIEEVPTHRDVDKETTDRVTEAPIEEDKEKDVMTNGFTVDTQQASDDNIKIEDIEASDDNVKTDDIEPALWVQRRSDVWENASHSCSADDTDQEEQIRQENLAKPPYQENLAKPPKPGLKVSWRFVDPPGEDGERFLAKINAHAEVASVNARAKIPRAKIPKEALVLPPKEVAVTADTKPAGARLQPSSQQALLKESLKLSKKLREIATLEIRAMSRHAGLDKLQIAQIQSKAFLEAELSTINNILAECAPDAEVSDVTVVVIQGLPSAICNLASMEAVLQQAGLQSNVEYLATYGGEVEGGSGQAKVGLRSKAAVDKCFKHFHGLMWHANIPVNVRVLGPMAFSLLQPIRQQLNEHHSRNHLDVIKASIDLNTMKTITPAGIRNKQYY